MWSSGKECKDEALPEEASYLSDLKPSEEKAF